MSSIPYTMPKGRPRKYFTAEAQAGAKQKYDRQEYLRRKNSGIQHATRSSSFIHYKPTPASALTMPNLTTPTTTQSVSRPGMHTSENEETEIMAQLYPQRPEYMTRSSTPLGAITPPDPTLPISTKARVHRYPIPQPKELLGNRIVHRSPLAVDDIEAAVALSQLRGSEREWMKERADCYQPILQQIKDMDAKTTRVLREMQACIMQLQTSTDRISDHLRISDARRTDIKIQDVYEFNAVF